MTALKKLLSIKNYNEQSILRQIYFHPKTSRIELSKKLNLSPTAVSDLAGQLIESGLLVDVQETASGGMGRPARGLVFNKEAGKILVVKEDYNLLSGRLLNLDGEVLSEEKQDYNVEMGFHDYWSNFQRLVDSLLTKTQKGELWGIGVIVRGIVTKTQVYMHSKIKGWGKVELYEKIQERYNIYPYIVNLPNAAAKGEVHLAREQKMTNLLYLNWGISVGVGIIINRQLYFGSNYISGEVGHIIVDDRSSKRCYCGKYGCLEAVATGRSLLNDIIFSLKEGVSSSLEQYNGNFSMDDIITEARKGDKLAYIKLKEKFQFMGKGLAMLSDIFDPDTIIIGGSMIQAGKEFFEFLKMGFSEEMLSIPVVGYKEKENISIQMTEHNSENTFLGVLSLILEDKLDFNNED